MDGKYDHEMDDDAFLDWYGRMCSWNMKFLDKIPHWYENRAKHNLSYQVCSLYLDFLALLSSLVL